MAASVNVLRESANIPCASVGFSALSGIKPPGAIEISTEPFSGQHTVEKQNIDFSTLHTTLIQFFRNLPSKFSKNDIIKLLDELVPLQEVVKQLRVDLLKEEIVHSSTQFNMTLLEGVQAVVFDLVAYFELLLEQSGKKDYTFYFPDCLKNVFFSLLSSKYESLSKVMKEEEKALQIACRKKYLAEKKRKRKKAKKIQEEINGIKERKNFRVKAFPEKYGYELLYILQKLFPEKEKETFSIKKRGFGGAVYTVPGTTLIGKAVRFGDHKRDSARRELFILSLFDNSPELPKLRFFEDPDERVVLYIEREGHSNLRDAIRSESYNEIQFFKDMHKVSKGLCTLHDLHFFHSDIKPSNIVNGKLIDFGSTSTYGQIPTTMTRDYLSPEFFMLDSDLEEVFNGYAHDIWQIGCVLLEFFSKQNLFVSLGYVEDDEKNMELVQSEVYRKIQKEHMDPENPHKEENDFIHRLEICFKRCHVKPEIAKIIRNCLKFDPSERYTAQKLCKKLEALSIVA